MIAEDHATSDTIVQNKVIETRPAAGQELDRGTEVTIVLSTGKQRVSVPKVVGLSLADATTALESAGFTVTVTRKEDTTADPGTVLSQMPGAASTALRRAASVRSDPRRRRRGSVQAG